jgi:hypothetical protein
MAGNSRRSRRSSGQVSTRPTTHRSSSAESSLLGFVAGSAHFSRLLELPRARDSSNATHRSTLLPISPNATGSLCGFNLDYASDSDDQSYPIIIPGMALIRHSGAACRQSEPQSLSQTEAAIRRPTNKSLENVKCTSTLRLAARICQLFVRCFGLFERYDDQSYDRQ